MRVRFAPSPTGQLHVGNARTALFNWLLARGAGGTFILRIEDTDVERSTRESESAIVRDLRWLGLDWDEGPDIGGAHGPYRQSERLHLYQSYATELLSAGAAYYCFCSTAQLDAERQDALANGRPARYAGTCRRLSREQAAARIAAGERPAIRFRVPEERDVVFTDAVRGDVRFQTDVIGDPIIVRADGTPAYNFAVVVDDALMEVTHVVRGEDHISNTPRQILLYEALGFAPPTFAHLSLVMGPDHSPLSKRHGATSVAEFRGKGYLPEALVNYLALIGWSPGGGDELLPIDELARRFSLEAVGHSAGVFDEEKLAWANRHYLKIADPTRLAELALPYFNEAGVDDERPMPQGLAFLASAIGDGERVGRSVEPGAGAHGAAVRLRRGGGAGRPAAARGDARRGRARRGRRAGGGAGGGAAARPRKISRDREPSEGPDESKGESAVPPHSRRPDRARGRRRAGSRRAGDRSRRRVAAVSRYSEDHRQPRARGRIRARAGGAAS